MRIVELNWFERSPRTGVEQLGEPDACYELIETPDGSLEQGEAVAEPNIADAVSIDRSIDSELNGTVNHSAIVRFD